MKTYFISFVSSPCFLPSSLCGTEPFLHHPAPLATTHEPASTVGLRKLLPPIIPRDQPTHGSDQLTFSLPYRPSGTEPLPTNPAVSQLLQDAVAVAELFASGSLLSILRVLPSALLGADPFLYHPALLEPNRCLLRPWDRGLSCACSSFALPSALSPLFF